jgi:hypothetical protein
MSIEQILLFFLFILLPLLNLLFQRIKRRAESEAPAKEPVTRVPRPPRAAPPRPPASRAAGDSGRRLEPPALALPARGRRFDKRSLLGTPRDLRRGIILMTLLGPCRALEQPDE